MTEIGENLRNLRKRFSHYSAEEMARIVGMEPEQYLEVENSDRLPAVKVLVRFAEALNIPVTATLPEGVYLSENREPPIDELIRKKLSENKRGYTK